MLPLEPTPYSRDYEITDAMFGAFRSPGGIPFFWNLFGWMTLGHSILYAIFAIPIFKSYGTFLMTIIEMGDAPTAEQTTNMMSSMFSIFPLILLMSVFGFALMGIVRATFYRGYFHGDTGGIFPFKFGADEVRQTLAVLGYWGMYLVAYLTPYILIIIVVGIFAALLGKAGVVIAAILAFIGFFGLIAFLIWVMVSLAPAGALTAMRGQTHVLAARYVTKNRFWALFGSCLVAGLIGYVVCYILMFLGFGVGLSGLFNADMMEALAAEDFETVTKNAAKFTNSGGFKIGVFLAIVLSSAGMAFYSLMLAGPTAYFTRQWAESGAKAYDERQNL